MAKITKQFISETILNFIEEWEENGNCIFSSNENTRYLSRDKYLRFEDATDCDNIDYLEIILVDKTGDCRIGDMNLITCEYYPSSEDIDGNEENLSIFISDVYEYCNE